MLLHTESVIKGRRKWKNSEKGYIEKKVNQKRIGNAGKGTENVGKNK